MAISGFEHKKVDCRKARISDGSMEMISTEHCFNVET